MRMRSPRIAPPVKGEEGSTATMPTRFPSDRHSCARRCTSVDLPAPGGPVIPTTRARPVREYRAREISGAPPSRSSAEIAWPIRRGWPVITPSTRREASGEGLIREWRTCGPADGGRSGEEALGNHEPLYLARSLADRAELHVPIELLDGIVLDESVASVDLDGFFRRANRNFGCVELGLGGKPGDVLPRILGRRGTLGEQPRGIDLRGHVTEVELDRFEFGDGSPELAPLFGVPQRRLVRATGDPERQRRD